MLSAELRVHAILFLQCCSRTEEQSVRIRESDCSEMAIGTVKCVGPFDDDSGFPTRKTIHVLQAHRAIQRNCKVLLYVPL